MERVQLQWIAVAVVVVDVAAVAAVVVVVRGEAAVVAVVRQGLHLKWVQPHHW